ncbi:unnamed protein product, partial [Polarella glacialis]
FERVWLDIIRFLLSMYSSGKRNTLRSRIKFVVVKLRQLSTSFDEAIRESESREAGLPWSTPSSSLAVPGTIPPVPPPAGTLPASRPSEAPGGE